MSNVLPLQPNRFMRPAALVAVVGSTLLAACGGGESGNPVAERTVTVTRTVTVPEAIPLDGATSTITKPTTPSTAPNTNTSTTPAHPTETTPNTSTTPAASTPNAVTTTPSAPNSAPAPTPNTASSTPAAPAAPSAKTKPSTKTSPNKPAASPCAPTDSTVPEKDKTVIALDPGHGPASTVIDAQSGLKQIETPNQPEMDEVWIVANRVRCSLQKAGYDVVMVKREKDEKITFRQRVQRAEDAHAALAVSIHGDKTLPNTGQIYPQKVGLYRGKPPHKLTFTNKAVAATSLKYAQIFQKERQKIEGKDVPLTTVPNFGNRSGFEPGNIPLVQLFSDKTPWVYNEKQMPFVPADYSYSLVKSIEATLPPTRTQVQTKQ